MVVVALGATGYTTWDELSVDARAAIAAQHPSMITAGQFCGGGGGFVALGNGADYSE
jgi:predicted carbohydrate-binding protein with CBM5 and CBM33 domain